MDDPFDGPALPNSPALGGPPSSTKIAIRASTGEAFAASDAIENARGARIEVLSGSELKDAKGQLARRWMKAAA